MTAGFLLGCSSDDSSSSDSGSDVQTSDEQDLDASAPDGPFPAFVVDAPQVVSAGGSVLNTPKVQPVFLPGFDYATQLTDFAANIGATAYWKALAEYKIGAITSATPIALTSAQINPGDIGNITDANIQSWLQARWDGTHPEFGTAPDPTTIYALFYPASTVIYLSGGPPQDGGVADGGGFGSQKSCTSFGGYHGNVLIKGQQIPYAVLPECPTFGAFIGVDAVTAAASHELSEAVTDPYPTPPGNPAYDQNDDDHVAWMFFLGGGEIGDMCAQFSTSFYKPTDFAHVVQRNWSNVSAKAGHDPCQPADGTPYFNAMPVFLDPVTIRGVTTKGIIAPVGQAKSLELDLFSDAPTTGPWKVAAQAFTRTAAAPVTFTFDNTSGQNGDKLHVQVTSTAAFTSSTKTATIVITSTLGVRENLWIGLIAQQ